MNFFQYVRAIILQSFFFLHSFCWKVCHNSIVAPLKVLHIFSFYVYKIVFPYLFLKVASWLSFDLYWSWLEFTLPTKVRLVKAMVFPVVMYGCESWTVKKAETRRIDALNCGVGEDSWESLGLQGDPPVHSEGDQPWDFFGRNDAKAETPVLWPPHVKRWLIGKDSDAGRDWGQEEKGTTEDEMAGWHHWLDGREFEWTPGVGDGLGGLACCDSWGRRELAMTEWLNGTELNYKPKLHLTTRSSNCTTMCLPNWVENYVHSKPAHVFFIAALLKIVTNWKQQVNG